MFVDEIFTKINNWVAEVRDPVQARAMRLERESQVEAEPADPELERRALLKVALKAPPDQIGWIADDLSDAEARALFRALHPSNVSAVLGGDGTELFDGGTRVG